MSKVVLYAKQGYKLRQWSCFADGAEVVVIHGQVGGKQIEKRYTAEAKNRGKINATSAEQQALLEVEAKVTKQLKSGYYRTQAEAMNHVDFTPMKAHNSNDYKHKIKYPCYIEPKYNGQRLMVNSSGEALSKQGEPLKFPEHWKGVEDAVHLVGSLDGEVFAGPVTQGGLPLQDIISAFRKKNANTPRLKYYVYDIPVASTMEERVRLLKILDTLVKSNNIDFIEVTIPSVVNSWEEVMEYTNKQIELGQEGAIVRNFDGVYEFGKRSYDLLKVKVRLDAEAEVLSYALDKNDEPVYTVRAVNGEQTGAVFKLKMKIPDGKTITGLNYRSKENAERLLGQHITYEYEELSSSEIPTPTKPVGLCVREVREGEGRW